MSLDIRVPIGLLFATLGGLLAIYGLFTSFTRRRRCTTARWASTSTSGGAW